MHLIIVICEKRTILINLAQARLQLDYDDKPSVTLDFQTDSLTS